jgi:hypothetical protein
MLSMLHVVDGMSLHHHQRDFVNKNRSRIVAQGRLDRKNGFLLRESIGLEHLARHDAQSIQPYRETISTPDGRELL